MKPVVIITMFFISLIAFGLPPAMAQEMPKARKWFIVLPLRFTHLQNDATLLSGVKVGRVVHERISLSASIYHSFYLTRFKSSANLNGFAEQPRLFINGMGGEVEYYLFNARRISVSTQLLLGWGFMTYELKHYDFKSTKAHYLMTEPSLQVEYRINTTSLIGLGIGYRPLLSNKDIRYSSDVSQGNIPLNKQLPNGTTLTVSLKGLL